MWIIPNNHPLYSRFAPVDFVASKLEIESVIALNLVEQMEQGVLDSAPVWTNVKTFNAKPFRGSVDFIFGGYPCQPFSVAGNQLGEDDPLHLWPYIKEIIRTVEPMGISVQEQIDNGWIKIKEA